MLLSYRASELFVLSSFDLSPTLMFDFVKYWAHVIPKFSGDTDFYFDVSLVVCSVFVL